MTILKQFSLDDKYRKEEGTIILSGTHALVRLPMDQHRADKRAGLNTATLVSGYRGSPLGGIDFELERSKKLLSEYQVTFIPGVNEDLAATAIFGSQLANLMPNPKYDGVVGMWYGKGPGVDRSGDAFKHANLTGVGRHGGVLALAGDDPVCKSSTIPSHSEVALYDAQMPILYPGNVQEIITLGRYGFEMSRYTGLWVGFKIVTDVADSYSTVQVAPVDHIERPAFEYRGRPWQPTQNAALLAPYSVQQEEEVNEGRLTAAKLFAAANPLNEITVSTNDDWLGLVAAGKTYYDVREALYQLGLDDEALRRYGIRLLKLGMIYPVDAEIVKQFVRGIEEIFIVEEKRGMVELFLRDILYNHSERPLLVGKTDEVGQRLMPTHSELNVDLITPLLAKRLAKRVPQEVMQPRLTALQGPPTDILLPMAGQNDLNRTAYFCSGCPHNRSTVVPKGSMASAGIGCHTLSMLMDRETYFVTQMGGEGAQWVGAAPFSDSNHIFQNIGDGTLFHSGYLAIRQAVAAGTNVTYKILYNGAVAMTGGQKADGEIPVPELTLALQAEGVAKTIVCTHDVDKYPVSSTWAKGAEVWDRDRLDEAQLILRDTPGVTALIYDQPCAADLRRKRKRGQAPNPATRVFINEAVCEGCGDCGVKSNCLSVFPVETEFGRKTQIHQSSCNKDYTCLDGDCPAFVTVIPTEESSTLAEAKRKSISKIYVVDQPLPEPVQKVPDHANIYMMGIGGTGVVTISQVLATAFLLDGKHTNNLDQTGLSQKGGSVVSHIKVVEPPVDVSNRISNADVDTYIVFDVLTGTVDKNLEHAHPDKTIAIVSGSQIPTGSMVKSTEVQFPQGNYLKSKIERRTRASENVYLDAISLAENLFGSHMPANMITLGAAYQAGGLPLSIEAVEGAIELNGVAVEANKQAFRVGRLIVAEPDWVPTLEMKRGGEQVPKPVLSSTAQSLVDEVGATGELKRLLEIRVPELIAYQNLAYARDYVAFVQQVLTTEQTLGTTETRLSEAVARYLFKLMAYKDEYEVARLHLKSDFKQALAEQFGEAATIAYQLHPPFLRAIGWQKKIGFGRWFDGAYWLLTKMKGLRGTPLDIFGYAEVRRVERNLIGEYRTLIEQSLADLSATNLDQVVELAELPDMIRGYEDVKLKNVGRFREVLAVKKQMV